MTWKIPLNLLVLAMAVAGITPAEDTFTRGIGIYPGDPREDFSPSLVEAEPGRRNLALHRAATQSSAYDYNLVAQLVTDGIITDVPPRWFHVTTEADGPLPKSSQPFLFDDNPVSRVDVGEPGWIGIELGGGSEPFAVDRVEIGVQRRNWLQALLPAFFGTPAGCPGALPFPGLSPPPPPSGAENEEDGNFEWSLATSTHGRDWTEVGRASTEVLPPTPPPFGNGPHVFYDWMRTASLIHWTSVTLDEPVRSRRYRLRLEDLDCEDWSVVDARFYNGDDRLRIGGPHHFGSAWRSAGIGDEWVAVDLGAEAVIDGVALHWIAPAAEGLIQIADESGTWRTVAELPSEGDSGEIQLQPAVEARHVRVLMTRPVSVEGYVLSELEVFGEGGLVAAPHPQPPPGEGGNLHLAGGDWRLQRDSLVDGAGEQISTVGFATDGWIVATVPGTVLTSYYNIGALPDLNYGDHELAISDAFFHADFWYRNEFQGPSLAPGQRAFIEFDGINWKAEVYLNGARLGRVEGAFMRGRFDVTEHLRPGETNALAVRVEKTASPGAAKQHTLENAGQNGGAIGADNPSYHASIGWDWIPTIRGRNIGLWNDVRLTVSGPVTLDDPWIRFTLPLPDTSSADLHLDVTLTNHAAEPAAATLRGTFGEIAFEQQIELGGASATTVTLDPSTHPQLRLDEPELWWPNGHGAPHLYDVELEVSTEAGVSDTESFQSGVRQVSFTEEDEALRIFVNGRRIVPRGGNWGFPEANLRYRGREYETAMRYHRDMNFTMVRNWVGQTGDDEFYEAADRNGLLVWQDFWLANPWDGPDPADEALFMRNARDTIRRIRNHPSVALYCGRNEGHPPPSLNAALEAAVEELHPEIHYIPNSMFGTVSGGGPYGVRSREFYFEARAGDKPHSELGMTSVVTLDSLERMMPADDRWPMGLHWGLHDFNLDSNQRARDYVELIDRSYGKADGLTDWIDVAQLVNYEGYRAMFEAQSRHRMGLQLWMSHPAWPSLTWQTYDYYFNPHAAYFGSKKGAEPLHIQWNPLTDEVEVVNYGVGDASGLTASAQVLRLDGTVAWESEAAIDSDSDSTVSALTIDFPAELTPVHFIRLRLTDDSGLISENTYWRGLDPRRYQALRTLPEVPLRLSTRAEKSADGYVLHSEIENLGDSPALAVRLVAVGAESAEPILPALYSDNFLTLMPGEARTIRIELLAVDSRGETPKVEVEGFNVAGTG